ncbi:MAG: MBL fold metallo-hydrolase [Alphaproteobacteria bacterium]
MAKAFASTADTGEKRVSFDELAPGVYAYTAEGDPNTGVIVGDDGVMVIDTQATPVMARDVLRRIRKVTAKRVKYVVLSHYHAVRVLGASAYRAEHVIASRGTYELIGERGAQDYRSEVERFPRLFRAVESIPGLTWPSIVFDREMTIWMGKREVRIMHLGRGHTKGDTVVWLPRERVLFSGDLVEMGATPYCGDAYLGDWPRTLARLKALEPRKLVPGRGAALKTPARSRNAVDGTAVFLRDMMRQVKAGVARGEGLKAVYDRANGKLAGKYGDWVIFEHCLPFNISRAYDEASGVADPRIWTAARDREMWKALAG